MQTWECSKAQRQNLPTLFIFAKSVGMSLTRRQITPGAIHFYLENKHECIQV